MVLQVGMQLPRLVLRWAADAEQAFSIGWKDSDGEALDLDDTTVQLVIDGDTLVASNTAGGFSNWAVAEEESLATYIGKAVRLEFVIDAVTYLMAQGTVRAA